MRDPRRTSLPAGLTAKISRAFGSLWIEYAGERPTVVRTEIRGNVVTCRLIDAVGAFDKSTATLQPRDSGGGTPTMADYKRDAVAVIVRLTRQRVRSFLSSHDRDTDVATEVFTLEPSLQRGRPRPLAAGPPAR